MADALNGFDMVLALTQNAVNAQFETLYKVGLMDPSRAIMPAEVKWLLDTGGSITAELGPATVDFMPPNSNYQNAVFILPLTSGTFDTWVPDTSKRPPFTEVQIPIDNWTVAFTVDLKNMAFGTAARTAAAAGGALAEAAHTKLEPFSDHLFNVTALYYDFASANIANFDPAHTYLPGVTGGALTTLQAALTNYFKTERQQPYIVAIHAASKNPAATATGVAPTLVPTGVSYTTFGNASAYTPTGPPNGISTLNYLTSTGDDAPPPPQPNGIFTTPFVTDNAASGQLLLSRAAFFEGFVLKQLGQQLGQAFSTSNPLMSVSSISGPGISWSKAATILSPGSGSSTGTTTTSVNAVLSTTAAEIDISGTIATSADISLTLTLIGKGSWKIWRNVDFSAKISIAASADSHSLAVSMSPFTFTPVPKPKPRPDEKDAGARFDEIMSGELIASLVSVLLTTYTTTMQGWEEKVLQAGQATLPGIFVPPTGEAYSLTPLHFNASGDLVIDVNIETGGASPSGGGAESMEAPASDDLTSIEGIGPKAADLLRSAGIGSFARLAASSHDELRAALASGGSRFNLHDPTTWPSQAELAAAGRTDELKAMQDKLTGGR